MRDEKGGGPAPEPASFAELIASLNLIVGRTYAELACRCAVTLPESPLHGKGFAGALIEKCLGASAGNSAEPDFPKLALELKTMPVGAKLRPLESTFISFAPLTGIRGLTFEESALYRKIRRVLFVIVYAPRSEPLPRRRVLGYFFWRPSAEELALIRRDYEELMELVKTGRIESVSARLGTAVQLRPKCADGSVLTSGSGPAGELIKTRPRGFYLRRSFAARLLERCWHA